MPKGSADGGRMALCSAVGKRTLELPFSQEGAMPLSEPLRREQMHLVPGVEHLRQIADDVGAVPVAETLAQVDAAVRFLEGRLIPRTRIEDEVLYPMIGRILGSVRATRTMTRDHLEIARLAGQLERAAEEFDQAMLRRVLYGLYHLIKLHFAKEEELYFPLLDEGLSADEADEVLLQLRAA